MGFEPGDMLGDRRLRQDEFIRSLGEAAEFGNASENTNAAEMIHLASRN
jgi:hypothetical protein